MCICNNPYAVFKKTGQNLYGFCSFLGKPGKISMQTPDKNFLDACLFFSANAFSRHLVKLAEAEFAHLKISPAHASLLLLVFETPGITPKDLSRLMQLNPSTITRFIDALAKKNLVRRKNKGKSVFIFPTTKSKSLKPHVAMAYKNLYMKYSDILGRDTAILLSSQIAQANNRIMDSLARDADQAPKGKTPNLTTIPHEEKQDKPGSKDVSYRQQTLF